MIESSNGGADERSRALLEILRELLAELHPDLSPALPSLGASLERDLGLDSLARMELLERLEEAFRARLPEEEVVAAETPGDLLRLLEIQAASPTEALPSQPHAPVGEARRTTPEGCGTLIETLSWHVERHPDRRHLAFLAGDGKLEPMTYGELDRSARRVANGLRALGLDPDETVGLMLPSGLDYFRAFFGVLLAGGIPVPLYPPARRSQVEDHLQRQASILERAEVRYLITFPEVLPLARLLGSRLRRLDRALTVSDLGTQDIATHLPRRRPEDTAFLQFTSGSTGDPKGVILSHANLLANLRAIGSALALTPDDVVVSWLPLYHDMGLIGAWMGSLYFGMNLILMSPLTFLARPLRWLEAIHRFGGTASASPNFGFEHCLRKIDDRQLEGLDLRSWRIALNGAEPVSADTMRRFIDRFAPLGFDARAMTPVYGLAESSLGLSFSSLESPPRLDLVDRERLARQGRADPAPAKADATPVVCCGTPLPGHDVRVVDEAGRELPERRVGRLQFRGPSATSGYFRNPGATSRLLQGDWLDSGDLAYLTAGEVYITGRAKDLIIRAGQNIYPQELEEAIGEVPGVRKGCVAVFGVGRPETGTERLVIVAETRERRPDGLRKLRERILETAVDVLGSPPDDIALVEPHSVPKTSSGKLRRAAAKELFESGRLGRGPRAYWWQLARLAGGSLVPRLRRGARSVVEHAYAVYFWATAAALALPVWASVVATPGLIRRRRLARRAARMLSVALRIPVRVEGLEHLSGSATRIVAINHGSYLDAFALTAALPPEGAFVAKKELAGRLFAGILLRRLGTLFVERSDAAGGIGDTRRGLDLLQRGQSLWIFPEGTFAGSAGLGPFRMGAFLLAVRAGAQVVPAALRGPRSILRGGSWFPRRGAVEVRILPPVEPTGDDWRAAVRLRDTTRASLLEGCGEPDLAVEPRRAAAR